MVPTFVDRIFPPFADSKREKPREMLYVAHETPPTVTALVASAQHAFVVLMLVVYTVIAGQEVGLSDSALRGFVALEIVVMGIATLLQGLRTRISSGHLIVHNPSTISIATFVAVSASFGIGAVAGAYLLSGVVVIVLSRFLPSLRPIFPPEITGVLLVLLGLSLVEGGIIRYSGFEGGAVSLESVIAASGALGTIVVVSVWANARLRVFAVALGILVGLALAVATGDFGSAEVSSIAGQPLFALPIGSYPIPTPSLVVAAAIPILLIEVISAVDSIGTGVAIDQMNNQKSRRPDLPMIGRLVTCHGVAVFLNGLTGTLSLGTSSANLGLAHATGVAARNVAVFAGVMLIAIAFLPSFAAFITLLPAAVMGAIIVYTAGYMFVVGMQLVMSRLLNTRRMFMVGLSMTVGAAIIVMPELTAGLPNNLKSVLGSGLAVGTLMAIVLNMIFRIGVAQTREIKLSGYHAGPQATDFLENCGRDWGARADVITRAGVAVSEALEALLGAHVTGGPPELRASFDEYKLILWVSYPGKPISFTEGPAPDLEALMAGDEEMEAALDAAMTNVSSHLIRKLVDEVSSSAKNGQAQLRLQFTH